MSTTEHAAPTVTEYIQHHLTNLSVGSGFWTFHLDTLIVSGVLGLLVFGAMALAARRPPPVCPGSFRISSRWSSRWSTRRCATRFTARASW